MSSVGIPVLVHAPRCDLGKEGINIRKQEGILKGRKEGILEGMKERRKEVKRSKEGWEGGRTKNHRF
jgi:hypothetical protein